MNRTVAVLALLFSAHVYAGVPKPPDPLCVDNKCMANAPEVVAGTSGVKWHPGHYMLVFRGDSADAVLSSRIPEVCREDALQGLQYRIQWYDLEQSQGAYSFGDIDRIYAALAACGKRLVLQVMAVEFGTTDPTGIVPTYLLKEAAYGGGVAKTNSGYIARLWEAPTMDRYIALLKALGARYDGKPNFEGIVASETATSGVGDGYTAGAWIAQLKRAVPAMVAAWPTTNVIVFNNYIQGSSEAQASDFVKFLMANHASLGGPDVLPPPHAGGIGERILRGELGDRDMRGMLPVMFAVQSPELGGKEGTFSPRELYDHCVNRNRCSHMFWIRNTISGGSAQQWDTGILPFIRQTPTTNQSCPSNYDACAR